MDTFLQPIIRLRVLRNLKAVGNRIWDIEHIPTRHRKLLEARYGQIKMQLFVLFLVLPVSYLGTMTVNWVWPGFFQYPYLFAWQLPSRETITNFWPLFIWLSVLIVVGNNHVRSSAHDEELLVTGLITGNLAGVWEELGYRFIFICFSMMMLVAYNWLFGTVLVWIMIALFGIIALASAVDDKHGWGHTIFFGVLTVISVRILGHADPIFWLYTSVLLPAINWLALGAFTEIFTNQTTHQPLMVMGAVLANAWFRDGHKYQGLVGFIDSWVVGFVFMYATFTYGLMTAVILHCLWNTSVYVSIYGKRKLYGEA